MLKKNKTNNKNMLGRTSSIIKRNWKKLSIIIAILVCLLTGLGVGLYFVFRPSKPDLRSDVLNNHIITPKQAKEHLLNDNQKDRNKAIGLFFYKEESEITNFLTWGDSAGKKAKKNIFDKKIGPLSTWATNSYKDINNINWYAININKHPNIASNLFLENSGSNTYIINPKLIKDPSGLGDDVFHTIDDFAYSKNAKGQDDYKNSEKNYKTIADVDKKKGAKGNKASDWNLELSSINKQKDKKPLKITEATTLIFNKNHNLSQIINFKSIATDSKETTQLEEYYKLFFQEVQNKANKE